jgi:hypothetical protein
MTDDTPALTSHDLETIKAALSPVCRSPEPRRAPGSRLVPYQHPTAPRGEFARCKQKRACRALRKPQEKFRNS